MLTPLSLAYFLSGVKTNMIEDEVKARYDNPNDGILVATNDIQGLYQNGIDYLDNEAMTDSDKLEVIRQTLESIGEITAYILPG